MRKLIFLTFLIFCVASVFAQAGGNSIEFDEANEHIRIGSSAAFSGFNFSGDFTVEFWVKPNSVTEYTAFISKWDRDGERQWSVEKANARVAFKVSSTGAAEDVNWGAGTPLVLNEWVHIAAVRSGTSLHIYVNGVLNRTVTGPSSINSSGTADVIIGGALNQGSIDQSRSCADEIDEVRIWNTALSQSTIQEYMLQVLTNSSHPNSGNLQGYWRLNESSGSTASDNVTTVNSGGTAHSGSLVNCENDEWGTTGAKLVYNVEAARWDGDATNGDLSAGLTITGTNFTNTGNDFIAFGDVTHENPSPVTTDLASPGTPSDGFADQRFDRVWYLSSGLTGKEGTFVFDLNAIDGITTSLGSASEYFLLYRSGVSGNFTNKGAAVDVTNQVVTFGTSGNYEDIQTGYYTIGAESDVTLPVELATFNVAVTNQKMVSVTWATQSETDMNVFNILRNDEKNASTAIGVGSKEATNTSIYTEYNFDDEDVVEGKTYYYWIESVDHANNTILSDPVSITVVFAGEKDEEEIEGAAEKFGVINYPNPFNPVTNIQFNLKEDVKNAQLEVYNILGQKIKTINVGSINAEEKTSVQWTGTDENGSEVSSGIYLFKLKTSKKTYIRKGTLLK